MYRQQEWSRNSFTLCIGGTIAAIGLLLLLWNECDSLHTSRSLDEGHAKVVVPETIDVVFEENEGRLVLVSGPLAIAAEDALTEQKYGISIRAVKLRKKAQMYQWYEHVDRLDLPAGGVQDADHDGHVDTSYSYRRDWFDHLIDSRDFDNTLGHTNPDNWPINSSLVINPRVKIGNFLLGSSLKAKFTSFTVFTSDERPADKAIKMHTGLYFHAQDVWKPEVGDIRIQFSYAGRDGDLVTVVGRQSGREIRPFITKTGNELLLMHEGLLKPSEVFHREHAMTRAQTWIYRMCAVFLTFLGSNCCGAVLEILVMEHRTFRTGLILGYLSLPLVVSLMVSALVASLVWILHKPVFGAGLLVVSCLPMVIGLMLEYRKTNRTKKYRYH